MPTYVKAYYSVWGGSICCESFTNYNSATSNWGMLHPGMSVLCVDRSTNKIVKQDIRFSSVEENSFSIGIPKVLEYSETTKYRNLTQEKIDALYNAAVNYPI